MAWFFHVIERDDGRWACGHGRNIFDHHDLLVDALTHIHEVAAGQQPAEIFLHRLNSAAQRIDTN